MRAPVLQVEMEKSSSATGEIVGNRRRRQTAAAVQCRNVDDRSRIRVDVGKIGGDELRFDRRDDECSAAVSGIVDQF
jgi:hypothetical protein